MADATSRSTTRACTPERRRADMMPPATLIKSVLRLQPRSPIGIERSVEACIEAWKGYPTLHGPDEFYTITAILKITGRAARRSLSLSAFPPKTAIECRSLEAAPATAEREGPHYNDNDIECSRSCVNRYRGHRVSRRADRGSFHHQP